ncbi:hypothetical protein [uncultured Alistipes sp.]|uniref:InlB B-repeat-containing protein n=1 Tax=uncultured Alistipes sp. TaxID=538949 RepID=UPI0025F71D41|nr:hypothetical protein [uncultured Alistipes sp.]
MKTTPMVFAMLFAIVALAGCKKDNDPGTYTITVIADTGGTVSADNAKAKAGTVIELTATPNTGYEFSKWTVERGSIDPFDPTANPATFTMPAYAVSIKAEFTPAPYISYVAGNYAVGPKTVACLWTDGVAQALDVPAAATFSTSSSVAVSGTDVYVLGKYTLDDTNDINCWWKNGTRTDIADIPARATVTFAFGMAVSGPDVYITGGYFRPGGSSACYWKNGVCTELSDFPAGASSMSNAIAVSGADVYIAGHYYPASENTPNAYLYKNTVRTDLLSTGTATQTMAQAIALSGGSVYVGGYYMDGGSLKVCQWKDGLRTDLPHPVTIGGNARSLAVSGTDIYVAGHYDLSGRNTACLWKNGAYTALAVPSGTISSSAYSVALAGAELRVAGYYVDNTKATACLWDAGNNRTDLAVPAGIVSASAYSIALVQR